MSDSFVVKSRLRDYEVRFGSAVEALVHAMRDGDVVLVDRAVERAHGERLAPVLADRPVLRIDASEQAKSFEQVGDTLEQLVELGLRKRGRIMVVGGGVTQDIGAFMATVLYRGVEWIFVPTTLLAQGDSCIGGKSSINFRGFKNLLGSFLPPAAIFIDVDFLESLPAAQVTSGIGEILHFLIYQGEEAFAFLEAHNHDVRTDPELLRQLIRRSLAIKTSVIEVDEFDTGPRQLFNYGHSFGHAIEAATDYAIPHGIAVSFGMDIANYISVGVGLAEAAFRDRVRNVAETLWPGYSIKDLEVEQIFAALRRDKKNVGSDIYVILTAGFGGTVKTRIDLDGREGTLIRNYFRAEAR